MNIKMTLVLLGLLVMGKVESARVGRMQTDAAGTKVPGKEKKPVSKKKKSKAKMGRIIKEFCRDNEKNK